MEWKSDTTGLVVPAQIHFGWGVRERLGAAARELGNRAFVIVGSRTLSSSGVLGQLLQSMTNAGIEVIPVATVTREPQVEDVDQTVHTMKEHAVVAPGDLVVGIGGGSALDLAKACAALAADPRSLSVKEYLEGVGSGKQLEAPVLPILALPTTAGTGSEATKNAVISSTSERFKKSLRSPQMVPRVALVDPELTVGVPQAQTAYSGMDAITQLIESYLSCRATPQTQALVLESIVGTFAALKTAYSDGHNRPARECLSKAALASGIALANSGLGMAHGVAAALGTHCDVPHGLACATLLPVALEVNRSVCEEPMACLAQVITGKTFPTHKKGADQLIELVDSLCHAVDIPRRLGDLGVEAKQLPKLVQGSKGNSMNGNPIQLTDEQLHSILEKHL